MVRLRKKPKGNAGKLGLYLPTKTQFRYGKTALTEWLGMLRRDWELRPEAVGIMLTRCGFWERRLGTILGETW